MTPWHEGRTFYACPCGAQDERKATDASHPPMLDCWKCSAKNAMRRWVPPAVARDRLANPTTLFDKMRRAALSAPQEDEPNGQQSSLL